MWEYVLKRLVLFIPTLFVVALLLFFLVRIVPGDAIDIFLSAELQSAGANQSISPTQREFLKKDLGIDKPLPIQFGRWISRAVRFDFGTSFFQRREIADIIRERLPRSAEIAVITLVIALIWGVSCGVISAVKQDTWIDYTIRLVTIGGIALPSFFVAVMLFFFSIKFFNWIPPLQYQSLWVNPTGNLKQIVLPCIVLGLAIGAGISRLTRSQVLEVLREDFVRTARAKGLQENKVVIRHVLRNSLLPVVTVAGLLMGTLMGGLVIIEQAYAIPGMGTAMIQAINQRDYPLIQGLVWILCILFMTSNLLVDIAYRWIDPRIRFQ